MYNIWIYLFLKLSFQTISGQNWNLSKYSYLGRCDIIKIKSIKSNNRIDEWNQAQNMRANFEKVLKTTWKWEKIESRILYASFSRTFLWQFAGEYYLYLNKTFLEAQLLYNYIDVTDKTHSLTGRLAILDWIWQPGILLQKRNIFL